MIINDKIKILLILIIFSSLYLNCVMETKEGFNLKKNIKKIKKKVNEKQRDFSYLRKRLKNHIQSYNFIN